MMSTALLNHHYYSLGRLVPVSSVFARYRAAKLRNHAKIEKLETSKFIKIHQKSQLRKKSLKSVSTKNPGNCGIEELTNQLVCDITEKHQLHRISLQKASDSQNMLY